MATKKQPVAKKRTSPLKVDEIKIIADAYRTLRDKTTNKDLKENLRDLFGDILSDYVSKHG